MSSPSLSFLRPAVRHAAAAAGLLVLVNTASAADWAVARGTNEVGPGENVSVTVDGKIVARLIYGEGQQKPFVAVYDEQGRAITNSGMDATGKLQPANLEPHQRGIFIGWKVIESDLGKLDADAKGTAYKGTQADTWSMTNGTTQQLVEIEKMATNDDSASIVAKVEWRAGTKDSSGSNLLLTETRRIRIYKPARTLAQIDVSSDLDPARDLRLGADVQHAGVHMRVDSSVFEKMTETSYLWSPTSAEKSGKAYAKGLPNATGAVKADNLKWGEFLFPLHGRWYSVTQMNSISNPVEEFSTREYGRFGFFFTQDLKKAEPMRISYRFVVKVAETPAEAPKRSAAQAAKVRQENDSAFVKFVHEVR